MRQLMSVLIDAQRYDMKMLSVDILMFENNIRLVAVAHAFHIFACDLPELFVCQFVFGRGVERNMENRIGCSAVGFEIRHEALHAGINIKASAFIVWFEHLLPKQHLGFILIHFLLVVMQGSTGRGTRSYIRNHSLVCFARLRISILRAFNSLVRCSKAAI